MVAWSLICGAQNAIGQTGSFLTRVWTSENGLPDSSVTSIAQTPDGYLWVGTYNGLARFDGLNFVTFDPDNTPALAHARVRRLHVDKRGGLWVNTFDGSLTSLRAGVFAREWTCQVQNDRENPLIASGSNSIAFSLDRGNYFIKSLAAPPGQGWQEIALPNRNILTIPHGDGGCLAWFNGATKRMWRLADREFVPMPEAMAIAGRRIRCATVDEAGRYWVGTDTAIVCISGTNILNVTPTNGEPELDVRQLQLSGSGGMWVFANGRMRKALGREWVSEGESLRGIFNPESSRSGKLDDRQGGLWIWDYGRGIAHVTSDGQVWRFTAGERFNSERATAVFEDREGNIWAGFEPGGLVRIRESRFRALPNSESLAVNAARSVCEDAQGALWVGSMGGGLRGWVGVTMTNIMLPGDPPSGSVFSVCPDMAGRLWVSAGTEDLYVSKGDSFERVSPVVHGVKAILADRSGRVWAGARDGLQQWDGQGQIRFDAFEGLGQGGVRALAEGVDGAIWCGGGDGILYRIADDGIEAFRPTTSTPPHAIWSLLVGADGSVWAGTFRGGLLRFKDRTFTRFSKEQGLPNNVICQILDDGRGNLWLGTQQGVLRVATAQLNDVAAGRAMTVSCMEFGYADGLPSIECSGGYQPGAWKTKGGQLWFTTLKGAAVIDPALIAPNSPPPPVSIEQVLVDGVVQWPKGGADVATSGPARAVVQEAQIQRLVVPPGRRQLEFHYVGLSLVSSERVQYRYQLEGEDEGWIRAGTRRFAHYGSLRPGDYRFRVLACNSDGIWNEAGSVMQVRILPHYYETWWFRGASVCGIIGVVFGIARYRFNMKLRRQTEQMERRAAVEQERARIAKDIHDDLGSSLTLIAVMGDLASQDKDHNRVEKMSATARLAVRSLDEIVWAVNPRNDKLANLLDYIGGYAVDYLSAAQIRCRLDVPEQMPAHELSSKVRYGVFLTVKEALQNIVKHSQAKEVWLRVSLGAGHLKIVISDNGRGFSAAPEDALADGLRNMRQRMSDIGGRCDIESRVGAGTEIMLELPFETNGGTTQMYI